MYTGLHGKRGGAKEGSLIGNSGQWFNPVLSVCTRNVCVYECVINNWSPGWMLTPGW